MSEPKEWVAEEGASKLWATWFAERSAAARTALFFCYADWVRMLASLVLARYPHRLAEWQDYVHFASLGLLKAIDRFNPAVQARFQTFAEPYVRGEILKGLSCYVKDGKAQAEFTSMGLFLDEAEVGEWSAFDTVVNAAIDLAFGYFLELGVINEEPVDNDPLHLYTNDRQLDCLVDYVERLPTREREVVVAHYFQYLSVPEVAELLKLSQPRVSQLHRQALKRIRQWYEQEADLRWQL